MRSLPLVEVAEGPNQDDLIAVRVGRLENRPARLVGHVADAQNGHLGVEALCGQAGCRHRGDISPVRGMFPPVGTQPAR